MKRVRLRVGSFLRTLLVCAGFVGFALSVLVGTVRDAAGNANRAPLLGSQPQAAASEFDISSSGPTGRCLAGQELDSGDCFVSTETAAFGELVRYGRTGTPVGTRAVAVASLVELGIRLQI